MTRTKGLVRDAGGSVLVEFALILPVLLLLICGGIELGHAYFTRAVLEGAVTEAARVATASLETDEEERATIVIDTITSAMSGFPKADGQSLSITTTVYADFTTAVPENYTDANDNGQYDLGESYVDRNGNGTWDPDQPIEGTLGGPGDVVGYTAIFPKRVLFGFLSIGPLKSGVINLKASTVMRNESVARRVAET